MLSDINVRQQSQWIIHFTIWRQRRGSSSLLLWPPSHPSSLFCQLRSVNLNKISSKLFCFLVSVCWVSFLLPGIHYRMKNEQNKGKKHEYNRLVSCKGRNPSWFVLYVLSHANGFVAYSHILKKIESQTFKSKLEITDKFLVEMEKVRRGKRHLSIWQWHMRVENTQERTKG